MDNRCKTILLTTIKTLSYNPYKSAGQLLADFWDDLEETPR